MVKRLNLFFTATGVRAMITGTVLFLVVSGFDYWLRNGISIDVFYFLPIFILTWHGNRRWGIGAAVAGFSALRKARSRRRVLASG